MKYLFLLTILISCNSGPGKAIAAHKGKDTAAQVPAKFDTTSIDIHNPYETGKDTGRLNSVLSTIFNFPEVKEINKQIDRNSKGKHGVAIMVSDEFEGDTSYYLFEVGDNSHADRYVNIYDFLLEKKTGQVKAYDHLSGSIMSLQDWRKARN